MICVSFVSKTHPKTAIGFLKNDRTEKIREKRGPKVKKKRSSSMHLSSSSHGTFKFIILNIFLCRFLDFQSVSTQKRKKKKHQRAKTKGTIEKNQFIRNYVKMLWKREKKNLLFKFTLKICRWWRKEKKRFSQESVYAQFRYTCNKLRVSFDIATGDWQTKTQDHCKYWFSFFRHLLRFVRWLFEYVVVYLLFLCLNVWMLNALCTSKVHNETSESSFSGFLSFCFFFLLLRFISFRLHNSIPFSFSVNIYVFFSFTKNMHFFPIFRSIDFQNPFRRKKTMKGTQIWGKKFETIGLCWERERERKSNKKQYTNECM